MPSSVSGSLSVSTSSACSSTGSVTTRRRRRRREAEEEAEEAEEAEAEEAEEAATRSCPPRCTEVPSRCWPRRASARFRTSSSPVQCEAVVFRRLVDPVLDLLGHIDHRVHPAWTRPRRPVVVDVLRVDPGGTEPALRAVPLARDVVDPHLALTGGARLLVDVQSRAVDRRIPAR